MATRSRKQSTKVKPRNQSTKPTLEERMARLESQQASFWRAAKKVLDRLNPVIDKIERLQDGLFGKVKAKRLSAKAGVRNG